MARVLVTGATGFLGKRTFDTLKHLGYEVFGTTTHHPSGNIMLCDISDYDAVLHLVQHVEPDIIIHCAAISSVTAGKPLDYYKTNVTGTENFLVAIADLKRRVRFIFISTAGVYGNQDVPLLHEGLCPKPVHHYGMSKFCAERVLHNYTDVVDFTTIRPFNIIGIGQDESFIVPKLISAFARGDKVIRLGNIDVYRDYIDVDSATLAIIGLIDSDISIGETVNLCTERGTSLRELIKCAEEVAGYKIEIIQDSQFVRKAEVWKLLGSREKLDRLTRGLVRERSLTDVLKEMLNHYLELDRN